MGNNVQAERISKDLQRLKQETRKLEGLSNCDDVDEIFAWVKEKEKQLTGTSIEAIKMRIEESLEKGREIRQRYLNLLKEQLLLEADQVTKAMKDKNVKTYHELIELEEYISTEAMNLAFSTKDRKLEEVVDLSNIVTQYSSFSVRVDEFFNKRINAGYDNVEEESLQYLMKMRD